MQDKGTSLALQLLAG